MSGESVCSPPDASAACGAEGILEQPGAGSVQVSEPKTEAPPLQPPSSVRELERALRGLGYSRTEAAGIARYGFGALKNTAATTDDEQFDQLRDALERTAKIFRK